MSCVTTVWSDFEKIGFIRKAVPWGRLFCFVMEWPFLREIICRWRRFARQPDMLIDTICYASGRGTIVGIG